MNSGLSPLQAQLRQTPALERACHDPRERWLVFTPDGVLYGAHVSEAIGAAAQRALVAALDHAEEEASGWRFSAQSGGGGAAIIATRQPATRGAVQWADPEHAEVLTLDLRRRANGVILGGPGVALDALLWELAAHEAIEGQSVLCVGDADPTARHGATIVLDRPADAGAAERTARLAGQLDGVFWDELRAADELRTLGAGIGARGRWASVRTARADEALRAIARWVAPLAPGFALHHFIFLEASEGGEGVIAHAIAQLDGMWMVFGEPPASALPLIEALFPVEALLSAPAPARPAVPPVRRSRELRAVTPMLAAPIIAPIPSPPHQRVELEPISAPSLDLDEGSEPELASATPTPVAGLDALELEIVPNAPPEPSFMGAPPSDTIEVLEALVPTPTLELSAAAESFHEERSPLDAVSTVQELFEDSDAPGEVPWALEEIPESKPAPAFEWPREPSRPTPAPAPEALIFDRPSERRHTSPHPALKRPTHEPTEPSEASAPSEVSELSEVSQATAVFTPPQAPMFFASKPDPKPIPGAIAEATTQVVSADLLAGVLHLSEPSDVLPDEAPLYETRVVPAIEAFEAFGAFEAPADEPSSLSEMSSEVDEVHAASTQVASADILAGVLHLSGSTPEPAPEPTPEPPAPVTFATPASAPEVLRPRTISGDWSPLVPEPPAARPAPQEHATSPEPETALTEEWSAPSTMEGLPFATSDSGELLLPEPSEPAPLLLEPSAPAIEAPAPPAPESPPSVAAERGAPSALHGALGGMHEPSEFMFDEPLDDFAPPPSVAEPMPELPPELAGFEALGLDRLVRSSAAHEAVPMPTPEPTPQPAHGSDPESEPGPVSAITESSLAAQRWLDELSDVGDPLDDLDVSDPTPSLLDRLQQEETGLETESEREDLSLKLRAWRRKARGRRGPDGLSEMSESGLSFVSDSQEGAEDDPHSQDHDAPSGELELPLPNLDDLFDL